MEIAVLETWQCYWWHPILSVMIFYLIALAAKSIVLYIMPQRPDKVFIDASQLSNSSSFYWVWQSLTVKFQIIHPVHCNISWCKMVLTRYIKIYCHFRHLNNRSFSFNLPLKYVYSSRHIYLKIQCVWNTSMLCHEHERKQQKQNIAFIQQNIPNL